MELAQKNEKRFYFLGLAKSFLVWSFALTVCLLVVGFPVVVLMATVGVLLTVILQSVMPVSAVALVAGSIIGANILAVVVGAGLLTLKGIHPDQVSWLRWLHGEASPLHNPVYAACPLTCEITEYRVVL